MRKRLIALVAALVLACSLAPGIALADEGSQAAVPVTIEIGADGAPVGTSGDGWTYDGDMLTLETEHVFTFTGRACDQQVDNYGTIVGGEFNGTVGNTESGTVSGGTFSGQVYNAGIISGGTFGGGRDVVNHEGGTICGGTFNAGIQNLGTIKGAVISHVYVQNGGTIAGGTFDTEASVDGIPYTNFGTIQDGSFNCEISNMGTITGGTFDGIVTNYNTIEGGFFAHPVVDKDGTMSAGVFPVSATLTGLSIAEATDETLLVTFEKDSAEANTFTLVADKDYTLPNTITLQRDSADGPKLVAGTDYTYDATTGTITIKKGDVTGPLFLVAAGVPTTPPTPPTPADPDTPDTPDTPNPEPPPAEPSTPTPLPTPTDTQTPTSTTNAPLPEGNATLVRTGDPSGVIAAAALACSLAALATLIAARGKDRRRHSR